MQPQVEVGKGLLLNQLMQRLKLVATKAEELRPGVLPKLFADTIEHGPISIESDYPTHSRTFFGFLRPGRTISQILGGWEEYSDEPKRYIGGAVDTTGRQLGAGTAPGMMKRISIEP